MKLEAVKSVVTSKVGRQVLLAKKNSPAILFVGGVVGVVGATVLACKATLQLEETLEESNQLADKAKEILERDLESYSESEYKRDLVLIKIQSASKVARLYGPAFLVGSLSIAALTGSHITLTRRNAGLMAAYSALDKGFRQYRDRVREELGDEKDLEFRHGTATVEEKVEAKDGSTKTVKHTTVPSDMPSMYARFFDETSPDWRREPEYNRFFLSCQQNWCNELLRMRGHLFLNEVYDRLGISRTKAGAVVGWVISDEGDNFVDFGIFDGDNWKKRQFVNGDERSILLDFNVDGVIWDLIQEDEDGS
jgi:hypothetical protein